MDFLLIMVLGSIETITDYALFKLFGFRIVSFFSDFVISFMVPVAHILLVFYSGLGYADKILSLANTLVLYVSSLPEYVVANVGGLLVASLIYAVTGKGSGS